MFIGGKTMDIVNLNNINAPIIPESNKIGKNYKKEIIMFSPSEFEAFIFEWIKFCKYKDQKVSVYNIGGTGDHGIDIAVFSKEKEEIYQCKRYEKPLSESQVKTILVKVLWYYFKDFNGKKYPTNITISTIKGFSVKAMRLFEDKENLKKEILLYYKTALDNEKIDFENFNLKDFENYLELFNYDNVFQTDIDEIIKDYINSEMKFFRFKDVKPNFSRRIVENINDYPSNYVDEISNVLVDTNMSEEQKQDYLNICKNDFYSAVSLRETCYYYFSETTEFDKIENNIISLMEMYKFSYLNDKFKRMQEILIGVKNIDLNDSYLQYAMHMVNYNDRKGTCHWLVNNGKFSWEK